MTDPADLTTLCREASRALGLPDAEALAQGRGVEVEGVRVLLHAGPDLACPVLVADIGAAPPGQALAVYRRLLQVQLLCADQADLRFGLDPDGETVVLSQAVRWGPGAVRASALAAIVRATAAQAAQWRDSLLAGDPDDAARPVDGGAASGALRV